MDCTRGNQGTGTAAAGMASEDHSAATEQQDSAQVDHASTKAGSAGPPIVQRRLALEAHFFPRGAVERPVEGRAESRKYQAKQALFRGDCAPGQVKQDPPLRGHAATAREKIEERFYHPEEAGRDRTDRGAESRERKGVRREPGEGDEGGEGGGNGGGGCCAEG